MSVPPLGLLLLILGISAAIGVGAHFWLDARRRQIPAFVLKHWRPANSLWISAAISIAALALALFASSWMLGGTPPQKSLAEEIGALSSEVNTLSAGLQRRPSASDSSTPPGYDPTRLKGIEDQLRQVFTRVTTAEGQIARQPANWSGPKIVLIGAIAVAAILLMWQLINIPWAVIVTFALSVGSITIISVEPDNIISITFERGASSVAEQPLFVLTGNGGAEPARRAYAVTFENGSAAIRPAGEDVIRALADALRPCIQVRGEPPLRLEVTGIVSSAPFVGEVRPASNRSNLGLAEQRSRAVADRLSRHLCPHGCTTEGDPVISYLGRSPSYDLLSGNRPYGDQGTPDDVRRRVEDLNRLALVTVLHPGRCAPH
jgi:hypothetical protein